MDITTAMQIYFKGERDLSLLMIPFGLAMLALAYYLWTHYKSSFGHSFMLTAIVVGLGLIGAGTVIMIKAERDLSAKLQQLNNDQPAFILEEKTRVEMLNHSIWPALKLLWTVLIIGSLSTVLLIENETVKGIAMGLLLAATVFMVVDVLAEKRAVIYAQHLATA